MYLLPSWFSDRKAPLVAVSGETTTLEGSSWWMVGTSGSLKPPTLQTEPKFASGDWSTRSRRLVTVVFLCLLAKPACCSAWSCRESHFNGGARIRISDALGGIHTMARAHARSNTPLGGIPFVELADACIELLVRASGTRERTLLASRLVRPVFVDDD